MKNIRFIILFLLLSLAQKSHALTIAADSRYYYYNEPGLVTHSGLLYGVWGVWNWTSFIGNGKLEGGVLYGEIEYDGALCDLSGTCTPHTATTTDVLTKVSSKLEYNLSKNIKLNVGAGLRYLYDRGNGSGFYQRNGMWIYLPLGLEIKFSVLRKAFSLSLDYEPIVFGQMKSNMSEVSSSFADITSTQTGYGATMTLSYFFGKQWLLSAYYELWDLNKSNTVVSNGASFTEPKNQANSAGMRLGYTF